MPDDTKTRVLAEIEKLTERIKKLEETMAEVKGFVDAKKKEDEDDW